MSKKLWSLLSILLIAVLVLTACGPKEEATEVPDVDTPVVEEPEVKFKVGFVTDTGGIDDQSFNTTQWAGIQRAVEELGVEAEFIQSDEASQYESNLTEFASQDYDLTIAAGFFLGGDLAKVAAQYPDLMFSIVDYAYPDPFGVPEGVVGNAECVPNIQGQVFKTDQAAFLAGYLAAGMTKTGKLGYFGGAKIPTVTIFGVGFQAGMEKYNEVHGTSVELLGWDSATGEGLFTGDFGDLTKGKEATESLFDEGVDIFIPVGGLIGSPGFDVARERGGYGVWVDVDGYNLLPESRDVMLTSVMKNMDNSVYDVIKDAMDGNFNGCGVYVGDIANAGVGIAPYHDLESAVPAELAAEVADLQAQIASGELADTGCLSYPASCPGGLYDIVVADEPKKDAIATITIWADDTRSAPLLPLADAFYDEYQVEVIVEEISSIRDNFTTSAPVGEGPDIFIGAHDWLGEVVASGLILPLDLGDKASLFTQTSIDGCTYEGELYCMPYATENLGFFYNTNLVETPPTTWVEVIEISQALMDEGKATYAMAFPNGNYDMFPLQTAFGGYIFGLDDAGNYNPDDIGLSSEGMIAAGQFVADQVTAGVFSDNMDWDTAHVLFETEEIPFLMAGPWALDRLRASGVPYAITNFPDGGFPFLGVQGFFVNAFSENPLLAQTFLTEFVATDEVMLALLEAGNRPSAFPTVNEAYGDPDLEALGVAGQTAQPMPAIPAMGSIWGAWGDAFLNIVSGADTPENALQSAADQVNTLLAGALAGMVNAPGNWQAAAGCAGDWDPACEVTALTEEGGLYVGTFNLPVGDYEVKIALDGDWGENYGIDGERDGANYTFSMTAEGTVTLTYDPETHLLTIETN